MWVRAHVFLVARRHSYQISPLLLTEVLNVVWGRFGGVQIGLPGLRGHITQGWVLEATLRNRSSVNQCIGAVLVIITNIIHQILFWHVFHVAVETL